MEQDITLKRKTWNKT